MPRSTDFHTLATHAGRHAHPPGLRHAMATARRGVPSSITVKFLAKDSLRAPQSTAWWRRQLPDAGPTWDGCEFVFDAGCRNYDWLVVDLDTDTARYSGQGWINAFLSPTGEPYRFMVWAEDGDRQAPPAADTFRIRIWYEDGRDIVLYDNGPDQEIGGGQITVHRKGSPAN